MNLNSSEDRFRLLVLTLLRYFLRHLFDSGLG